MSRRIFFITLILVASVVLIPLGVVLFILATPFDRKGVVIYYYSWLWSWIITHLVPGWTIDISGKENIVKGESYVVISNHQSLLDIPLLYSLGIPIKWVSKREVLFMPIAGWVLWMQLGIIIKRGDPRSAQRMISRSQKILSRHISVVIFPEGTRTKTGQVSKFQAGAFMMAVKNGCPILPVVIDGSFAALNDTKDHKQTLTIRVLPPITPQEVKTMGLKALASHTENTIRNVHQTMASKYYKADNGD